MNTKKLCKRYNELRKNGMKYADTLKTLSQEFYYSEDYLKKLVTKAFKETGIERYRRKGRTK